MNLRRTPRKDAPMTTPATLTPPSPELKPPAASPAQGVPAQARALLAQCSAVIRALDDAAYTAGSRVLAGGTVGKHVRHTLDHFRAALDDGLAGRAIDYDHRDRNVPMETQRAAALDAIGSLESRLAGLSDADLRSEVSIRVMLAADGAEALLGSTLARELAFASHHAVHHHAMIRAIAAEFGFQPGDEFGKAPSTLNYERSARG